MDEERTKKVLKWIPSGERRRGKPKRGWIGCADDDLRRCGLSNYIGRYCSRQRTVERGDGDGIYGWRQLEEGNRFDVRRFFNIC
jgi:hypothetical protein